MLVGRIVGAFGVTGELKLEPFTDFPERFSKLNEVYVGSQYKRHELVSSHRRLHGRTSFVLLRLKTVSTREQAQTLRGCEVWIPRSQAIRLPEGQYYADQIIGLSVETNTGVGLGVVEDVLTTGANDVYVVRNATEEVLVPAIRDVIQEIDVQNGKITIQLMDGMLG